tara:strand:+ start:69 stop:272 length:204 start_codon:yes stop_codon:yes gene_type:complete
LNLLSIESNILLYTECTKLDIADGAAVAGLIKFSRANTTPKQEFFYTHFNGDGSTDSFIKLLIFYIL